MEKEGLIGAANHAGKREILVGEDEGPTPDERLRAWVQAQAYYKSKHPA